jgi:acetyl esterase/lipase
MNFRLFPVVLACAAFLSLSAGGGVKPSETLALWPAGVPGETNRLAPESDLSKPTDNLIAGKPIIRLGNVSIPTITVFRPSSRKNTGAAVLVFPGGGYSILALDLEGTEVCEWLNSIGVTAVLLKYRVPKRDTNMAYAAPLQDAQRAIGIVRHRAKDWGIDPARIGVVGFSAGGHGYGLRRTREPVTGWPGVAADWMRSRKMLSNHETH